MADFRMISPSIDILRTLKTRELELAHDVILAQVEVLKRGAFEELVMSSSQEPTRSGLERAMTIIYSLGIMEHLSCLGGYNLGDDRSGILYEDVSGARILILLRAGLVENVLVTRRHIWSRNPIQHLELKMIWNVRTLLRSELPPKSNRQNEPPLPLDEKVAMLLRSSIFNMTKAISTGDVKRLLLISEQNQDASLSLLRGAEAVLKLSSAATLQVFLIQTVGNVAYHVACQIQDSTLLYLLFTRDCLLYGVHLPTITAGKHEALRQKLSMVSPPQSSLSDSNPFSSRTDSLSVE